MPTASNYPAGLTGLLGLQNFGEMPREVVYSIAPVLEVREQLLLNKTIHGFTTFTPALGFVNPSNPGLAGSTVPVVPAGEVWWVWHVSLRLNPAAGISYRGQIVMREDPSQYTALSFMSPVIVNPEHYLLQGQQGFWMTPGCMLAANYDTVTGVPGADTSLMTFRYVPLRA